MHMWAPGRRHWSYNSVPEAAAAGRALPPSPEVPTRAGPAGDGLAVAELLPEHRGAVQGGGGGPWAGPSPLSHYKMTQKVEVAHPTIEQNQMGEEFGSAQRFRISIPSAVAPNLEEQIGKHSPSHTML